MPNMLKQSARDLVRRAEAEIDNLSVEEAHRAYVGSAATFVDLRDIRELAKKGRIPGAVHCPRGMLEFWVDPESPYFRQEFSEEGPYIFFCAAGWRSALATKTVQDMGMTRVAHISGGFEAWETAGYPIEPPAKKSTEPDSKSRVAGAKT